TGPSNIRPAQAPTTSKTRFARRPGPSVASRSVCPARGDRGHPRSVAIARRSHGAGFQAGLDDRIRALIGADLRGWSCRPSSSRTHGELGPESGGGWTPSTSSRGHLAEAPPGSNGPGPDPPSEQFPPRRNRDRAGGMLLVIAAEFAP